MAAIGSPSSAGTINTCAIQIPVITSIPCQLNVEIFRKSVYRDDNGDPRPVTVRKDLTNSTVIAIITPEDDSTRLRIWIEVNGTTFYTVPRSLSLNDAPSFKGILVKESTARVSQLKDPLSKNQLSQLYRCTVVDTIDPTDVCTEDPIAPEITERAKEKVRKALNHSFALMNAHEPFSSFGPLAATSPISKAGSPRDRSENENKAGAMNGAVINLSSPKAKPSPKTVLPSVFNFAALGSPKDSKPKVSTPSGPGVNLSSPTRKLPAINKVLSPKGKG